MDFKVEKNLLPKHEKYNKHEIEIAYEFAKRAYREFDKFVRAIVLFGSRAKDPTKVEGDIDILIITDDVSFSMTPELIQTYRLIVERLIKDISPKLHITTLKFTTFWEYLRVGDPLGVNMLRDGVALIDTGFFQPMQFLLFQGRIRPTMEAVHAYYVRAPRTLMNAKWHIAQATLDLYWAVIDSAHAALMKLGEMPAKPSKVAELMEQALVKKNLIPMKYVHTMDKFYKLSKKIIHNEIRHIEGREFDKLLVEADDFVKRMGKIIEKK